MNYIIQIDNPEQFNNTAKFIDTLTSYSREPLANIYDKNLWYRNGLEARKPMAINLTGYDPEEETLEGFGYSDLKWYQKEKEYRGYIFITYDEFFKNKQTEPKPPFVKTISMKEVYNELSK